MASFNQVTIICN